MTTQTTSPQTSLLPPVREGRHVLPDGRAIGYGLYGATDGPLVLVLDGPGSRGLGRVAAASADVLGITLLVPDRPGFGASTPTPGRSIAEVSEDLLDVARSLGSKRFGIVAQSGGTPYGLGVAAAAGDEVTGLAFVGAISPLGERGALRDVRGPMRALFKLARRAPFMLQPLLKSVARKTLKDPEAAARSYAKDLPEADAKVLEDPRMWAIHATTSAEAIAAPEAFAREARMLAKPWGIDLGAVRAPVAFWVGELDPTHPKVMSLRMAERLGGAPVTVVPGAATFAMVGVYPDLLRHAAALR